MSKGTKNTRGGRRDVTNEVMDLDISKNDLSIQVLRVPENLSDDFEKEINKINDKSCKLKRIVDRERAQEIVKIDYFMNTLMSDYHLPLEDAKYAVFVYSGTEFKKTIEKLGVGDRKTFNIAPYQIKRNGDDNPIIRGGQIPPQLRSVMKDLKYQIKLEPVVIYKKGKFQKLDKPFCDII